MKDEHKLRNSKCEWSRRCLLRLLRRPQKPAQLDGTLTELGGSDIPTNLGHPDISGGLCHPDGGTSPGSALL